MIVTLKDIAERLNVFISRVSRIVNKKYIGAETRRRVTEAFKKYNYTPNQISRSLKVKSTKTIGIVIANIVELYPNIEFVGTTLHDNKSDFLIDWQSVMLYRGNLFVSRKYENFDIIDRNGRGDSFASAFF